MRIVLWLMACLSAFSPILFAQSEGIKGKVVDKSTGAPIAGVSVAATDGKVITQTNDAGVFSVPASMAKQSIVFTFVGFKSVTVRVADNDLGTIEMETNSSNLTDVVVVGYGTVRKKDLTGAVVSVKGDEVRKVAAGNAMEALQGKMPGVDITRTSGGAGARPSVTVRGNRSILASNGPLYIVDGIQYGDFQDINPADIQSMEVLKDGSSTAIYGSRGANGVILITTKKGSLGKPKVSFGAYYGQSEVAGYPRPMTGPQYADQKRQAARTVGTWNSIADDPKVFTNPADLAAVQAGASYYWPGASLGKGSQQDYNIGLSAGSEKTKIFLSYGFFREAGLLPNDYQNRHSLRLNVDQALGNKVKVGLQSQLTYYDQNLRTDGILNQSNKVIPLYTPYAADGTLAKFPGNANQFNPLYNNEPDAWLNESKITRILSTAYLEYRPVKSINFRSNIGITNGSNRSGYFADALTIERSLSTGSLSRVTNSNGTNILWENILSWNETFGNHKLGVTGLTSYIKNTSDNSSAQATGQLIADQLYYALQNNPANLAMSSSYTSNTLVSGALRLNYAFRDKYLLSVTGRSDGASQLAEGNKWAFFPSVAAAWRISDESFMENLSVLSDLKLRASYGKAGNSAVSPYSTQSSLMLVPFSWNNTQALAYALSPQTGNPNLGWEITGSLNIGLDFGLWNQRVSGSIDWYDSQTEDLLLSRDLPPTSGVLRVAQNIGKTHNKGIEIGLQANVINKGSFSWTTAVNYTANKEEIVELVGKQDDIANGWFIGYPVKTFYDYQKVGIWQTADSALARSFGYKPGDIRINDVNGDKKFTAADDRLKLGSEVPEFIVGWNNDFKFHGFDLNVYVFARQGQMFVSDYAGKFEPNLIENGAAVNYWTPENPTNDYPRPSMNISRASLPFASTLGYKDGSYIKIRNISLGYTLPRQWIEKLHISNLRVYVNARNYFTFSKVHDYDPEGEGSFERPLTKMILGGINVDF